MKHRWGPGSNGGRICYLCGQTIFTYGLCSTCQAAVTTFQRAFGHDEGLAISALQYLQVHWHEDIPKTSSPAVGEKRCTKCERVQPLTEFYFNKGRPVSYCHDCRRAYQRAYQRARVVPKRSR